MFLNLGSRAHHCSSRLLGCWGIRQATFDSILALRAQTISLDSERCSYYFLQDFLMKRASGKKRQVNYSVNHFRAVEI